MSAVWITISLFSEKHNWTTILCRGIKPFLRDLKKHKINTYHIEFNYENSENIRFCFFLKQRENSDHIISTAHSHFKDFFYNNNLFPYSNYTRPIVSIFPPFPLNTVAYGLYTPSYDTFFSSNFSQLIIQALTGKKVTDSIIFSYAFIFHLGALRAFARVIEPHTLISPPLLDIKTTKSFEETFRKNDALLLEIFDSIYLQPIVNQGGFKWLSKWEALCSSFIDTASDTGKTEGPTEAYLRITAIIKGQLGIGNEVSKLLLFSLSNILNRKNRRLRDTYMKWSAF